jgi:hypothetical protein
MNAEAGCKLRRVLRVVAVFAGTVACAKEHPPATLARSASQAAALPTREPVLEARPPMVDAGQPSIECPLAKQGIHPADLRPFKDTEKYIAFLEQPERAKWQRPDAVIAALSLAGNETVVDVGAGSGYFSFRLARALPRGMVVATDIQPEMVRHMHHKAMTEGAAKSSRGAWPGRRTRHSARRRSGLRVRRASPRAEPARHGLESWPAR